jgi:hypothetical protein
VHAEQATPPAPHAELDSPESGWHVPLAVQQPAHAAPPHVQAPFEHDPLPTQGPHAPPPEPHAELDCAAKGRQALPLQQPRAHEVASQTHCPVVLHS